MRDQVLEKGEFPMQTMTIGETVTQPWTADSQSPVKSGRTTELVELMLKDRRRLDLFIRDETHAPELIPRLLAVSLLGFTIFGIAATLIINLGGAQPAWVPRVQWSNGTWASLTLAYVLGLVAAVGVCLPSFYFYGLLAGVKLTMLQAAAHAVKCLAITAVVLVGVLPIYVAGSLGMIVFSAPIEWTRSTIALGLALPFISGLAGVRSLFIGFAELTFSVPSCQQVSRTLFLRRLTLAWSVCYTTVTPVMIYWLWTRLAG
jgi:hypothetical protein